MTEVNRWDGRDFGALIIRPKLNPIPLYELIHMAGAKAKRIEGRRNSFYNILRVFYAPEYHVYVVLYERVLSEGRRRMK